MKKDPEKEAIDRMQNQIIDNAELASNKPVMSAIQPRDVDPVIEWLQDLIIENTPSWAHFLAWAAQQRGLQWIRIILPLVRKWTDVHVKTETNMKSGKGFRPGSVLEKKTLRVFKRGRMIGEKTFDAVLIRNSAYGKIV